MLIRTLLIAWHDFQPRNSTPRRARRPRPYATVFRGFCALDDLAQELAKTTVAQEATNQAQELAKTAVAQEATKQAHANVRLRQLELKTLKWKRKHSRVRLVPCPGPGQPAPPP